MLDAVNKIYPDNMDLNLLLHDRQTLDYCQNKIIMEGVELFILETKRQLWYGSAIVLVSQIVYLRNKKTYCMIFV